jgi:hypothetical protein
MRKYFGAVALAAVALSVVLIGTAAGSTVVTPNGTWTAYPGQSTSFQAAVQQPIDSANTSNWTLKSKGAIPIMFKLSAGTGPLAFESIYSDNTTPNNGLGAPCYTGTGADHANDCSFLDWKSATPLTFADITKLSAVYAYTLGDCQGGSLRWTVTLKDTDNVAKNLDVHYQPGTGGIGLQNCAPGTSGANLIQSSDNIYVTQNFNGTHSFPSSYNNYYSDVLAQLGNLQVLDINLIVDSGWGAHGDQRVNLTSGTVGVGGSSPYEETFLPQPGSAVAPTCNLPEAHLRVTRVDPTPDGAVNEEPVQAPLVDSGDTFRTVDCKYMYNLSIPSLKNTGPGTYQIELLINGNPVPTPGSLNGKVLIDVRG